MVSGSAAPALARTRNMPKRLLHSWLLVVASGCGQSAPESCPAPPQAGCPETALSYDTGIGTLIHERCFPCHDTNGVEARGLLTDYTHVYGERTSIASQLLICAMPPAGAPALSIDERAQILNWLACNAPQ